MPDEKSEAANNEKGWLASIWSSPNDSTQKTLLVALALCLVCSIAVSSAAVLLKPMQQTNISLDRKKNILSAAGLLDPEKTIDESFQKIEPRVINLETGEFADDVDPSTFDQRKAATDPAQSQAIPQSEDIAGIKSRARYANVYLVRSDDGIEKIILPVHGNGLFSTLYGFLALEGDANTIYGLTFYEHGETPGLGGEVDNPAWRSQWQGKTIFDDTGEVRIELVKGGVDPQNPAADHQVDALSGASLTSRGVTNLLQYWMGDNGFGPFIEKVGAL